MKLLMHKLFRQLAIPLGVGFTLLIVAGVSRAETKNGPIKAAPGVLNRVALNPQPLPPRYAIRPLIRVALNPQPLPPRFVWSKNPIQPSAIPFNRSAATNRITRQ